MADFEMTEVMIAWQALAEALLTGEAADVYKPLVQAAQWAKNEDGRQHALCSGAIPAVVNALRRTADHPQLVIQSCRALVTITKNGSTRKAVASAAGAFQALVAAMRAHEASWQLQEELLVAIEALVGSANGTRERELLAAGGVEQIIRMLGVHADRARVQELGCCALRAACATADAPASLAIAAAVLEADGLGAVVSAMNAFVLDTRLQEEGCLLIAALTCHSDRPRLAAIERGAVAPLLAALGGGGGGASDSGACGEGDDERAVRPSRPELIGAALCAIGDLANGPEACRVALVLGGAGAALVGLLDDAASVHATHVAAACAALGALAAVQQPSAQAQLDSACVRGVGRAMDAHPKHGGVQEAGCAALYKLVADSAERRLAAAEVSIGRAVCGAMGRHVGSCSTQAWACLVVRSVALDSDATRATLAEAKALPRVLEAMAAHLPSPHVQDCGLQALIALSVAGPLEKAALEAGAAATAVAAIKAHPKQARVCELALELLHGYARNAGNIAVLSGTGVAPLIAQSWRLHRESQPCGQALSGHASALCAALKLPVLQGTSHTKSDTGALNEAVDNVVTATATVQRQR
jgi:hypothetical protein